MAIHRVYMFYMQHRGWYCQFLEEDPKASLPRKFTFATSDKVVELVERAGGVKNTETRQALEYGINIGRGGVFLNLTGEQYSKLREVNMSAGRQTCNESSCSLNSPELWKIEDIPACDDGMPVSLFLLKR